MGKWRTRVRPAGHPETARPERSASGEDMFFSFADLGFWRLAVLALVFELAHALLESHWPGIRGSRLGPRPLAAVLFMSAEAIALILAIAAGYRHSSKDAEGPRTHSGANLRYSCHGSLSNRRLLLVWQS